MTKVIVKKHKAYPHYRIEQYGRPIELTDEELAIVQKAQEILEAKHKAARANSRQLKADHKARVTKIKSLRDLGMTWRDIGVQMKRNASSVMSLYKRHYGDK